MPFYAGFDVDQFPQMDVMDWLNANTNLEWCGYYLAPAPNRTPCGWTGQYSALKDKWGVLPIYVGQQDPRTAIGNYTPSDILTTEQGTIDGGDAVDLMSADNFPSDSFVFLDWEYGGLDEPGSDYIKAWIMAVVARRAKPGIYCSHVVAQAIADVIDSINPTPNTRFWCWKVSDANSHPFAGDLSNIPTIDPSGCGYPAAQMWQREQNAIVTFPNDAPIKSLKMDFSTSSVKIRASFSLVAHDGGARQVVPPSRKKVRESGRGKDPKKEKRRLNHRAHHVCLGKRAKAQHSKQDKKVRTAEGERGDAYRLAQVVLSVRKRLRSLRELRITSSEQACQKDGLATLDANKSSRDF